MSNNSKSPALPQRPTLGLRGIAPKAIRRLRAPPVAQDAPARPAPPPPADDVPRDAPVSFCNWYVGRRRPSRRYLTEQKALAEARRLRAENPGAMVHTYRLELITEPVP